ncbi:hypothetical protein [Actinophytocola sp.]|uniref:hypothetical protein n=1 Tax=Actinophytocola sp. TaxID=1872138 RepID=UPI002D7FEAF1|nr:hypothetical protein [Actinophytocola sp.]HET9139228.1 hypothetical protein [Actinophytocola sp.]
MNIEYVHQPSHDPVDHGQFVDSYQSISVPMVDHAVTVCLWSTNVDVILSVRVTDNAGTDHYEQFTLYAGAPQCVKFADLPGREAGVAFGAELPASAEQETRDEFQRNGVGFTIYGDN